MSLLLALPLLCTSIGCALNQSPVQSRGWNGKGVFGGRSANGMSSLQASHNEIDLQMPVIEFGNAGTTQSTPAEHLEPAIEQVTFVQEDKQSVAQDNTHPLGVSNPRHESQRFQDRPHDNLVVRGQDPGNVPPATLGAPQPIGQGLQDPLFPQGNLYQGGTVPRLGSPNEAPQGIVPYAPMGNYTTPGITDIDVIINEAQTGRITFGAAFNSDTGVVGQIMIDERNFDIMRFPRSFSEIIEGTAWRGAGQSFRMELVPGSQVQRYLVSFTEPYLFDTNFIFSASAYLFDRRFFDWDEQRLGGRLSLGYNLTPELSVSTGIRLEDVKLRNPRVNTSPLLNESIGENDLYMWNVSLTHDNRNHPFMASEGHFLQLTYSQAFGEYNFPRGDVDYRRYFLIYRRPDFSGQHTLSLGTRLGFSGNDTPIFENYFAGGFSTMRGFDFRGASPVAGDVRVGGRFQWLNTVEYMFPITADDMIRGVVFTDFGTVEESITLNSNNFRVAPGFGFRIHMPVGGAGGAPLAFDFAFPVAKADTDDRQVFSFYLGILR